jgi:hypothetical protein
MKTLITLALTFAALASAQTVTITMTGVSPAVISDINTAWLLQKGPQIGITSAPLDGVATSVTVTVNQATLSAAQPMPAVGATVLLGSEPMPVTAVSGLVLTLTRGAFPPLNVLTAHPAGETISVLAYTSPWTFLTVPIRQWAIGLAQGLGAASAAFGTTVTGTVSP